MSIIAKNITTALTEREQGQGICLNQVLPGNLLSHSYNEVWLHTESVYISCDDNGYFEKAQQRFGSRETIEKILDRIVLIAPELENAGYWSQSEVEVEIHTSRGGIGFWQSILKTPEGWSHNYRN